jgi:hypothetical protein
MVHARWAVACVMAIVLATACVRAAGEAVIESEKTREAIR